MTATVQKAQQNRQRHVQRQADGTFVAVDDAAIIRTAFQPIFRSHDGKLTAVAFEALARPSSGTGPILPGAYFGGLPEAEKRASHAIIRHLHLQNGRHLPRPARRLFINFDPAILQTPAQSEQAIDALGRDLRAADISPRDVVCEFIENPTVDDAQLKHFTYALRARGYLIAIDDFGVDASDARRIALLTPDIVKFDGAMVRRLLGVREGFEQLAKLVQDFREQGIHSLLEGLETMQQVEQARRTGAHLLQGFALAAPQIAPGEFDAFMAPYGHDPAFPLVKAIR